MFCFFFCELFSKFEMLLANMMFSLREELYEGLASPVVACNEADYVWNFYRNSVSRSYSTVSPHWGYLNIRLLPHPFTSLLYLLTIVKYCQDD